MRARNFAYDFFVQFKDDFLLTKKPVRTVMVMNCKT